MKAIKIERNPGEKRLQELSVKSWPIWEKEVSEFTWFYDNQETCYFLAGEVEVIPDKGTAVKIRKNDLVIFPKGLSCFWKIKQAARKHYLFEDQNF
jgi:uncharacterized cupin superfamily protein